MKLHQLKAFLTVLEHKSFSEAALELGMAQASVSHAIAELERELGAKLLARGRFGAKATELGERVAEHARLMVKLEKTIEQEVALEQGVIQGVLKITTFRSAAGKIVPKVIAKLRKKYPKLRIQMVEVDHESRVGHSKRQLLRDHKVDIAFLDHLPEQNDLLHWTIMRDCFHAIVPLDYLQQVFPWSSAEEESLILAGSDDFCANYVRQHFASLGYIVEPSFVVSEDSTVVRMVSEGLGVGFLPELAIDELPENVKAIPTDVSLERPIDVAIMPSSFKVPAIRVFLHTLKDMFPDSSLPSFDMKQSVLS